VPGLLLSFAARLDAAKALVGIVGGGSGAVRTHSCPERKFCFSCGFCSGGYFPPLVLAYAVGLLMANVAVYLMNMGQPALLYLVPCTLGTFSFMAWRRNELRGVWDGPRVLDSADHLVYGGRLPPPEQTESSAGLDSGTNEELLDDEDIEGDVPLLSSSSGSA
jgi:hypothetical protein